MGQRVVIHTDVMITRTWRVGVGSCSINRHAQQQQHLQDLCKPNNGTSYLLGEVKGSPACDINGLELGVRLLCISRVCCDAS